MNSPTVNHRSPDSAICFRVRNIGNDRRTIQEGTFEVTLNDLIYVDSITHVKLQWPLRYIRRYGSNGDTFTFEAGSRCQSGPGVYTFATPQGMQIQNAVARNMSVLIQSPLSSRNHSPDPSFVLSSGTPPSANSYTSVSRQNGHSRLSSKTPSPVSSPNLSRSSSLRSLPENVFEVKNISDDQSVVQEGFLEVTATDLFYSDHKYHRKYQWPLIYLRKFGCDDDIFSIEAGRRCPGGEGLYAFKTSQASVLSELVQINTRGMSSSTSYFGSLMSLDAAEITSPATQSYAGSNRPGVRTSYQPIKEEPSSPMQQHFYEPLKQSSTSPTSSSPVFKRTDSFLRRAFSAQELDRDIFDVKNISEDHRTVGMGTLEVTTSELIYIDGNTQEKWRWPIRYLRKYGCDGDIFTIEAGRRCKGGAGIYAFQSPRAAELNETVVETILKQNTQFTAVGKAQSISRLSLAEQGTLPPSPPLGKNRPPRSASIDLDSGASPHFLTPPPPGRMRNSSRPVLCDLSQRQTAPQHGIRDIPIHQQQQQQQQQALVQEQQTMEAGAVPPRSSLSSPDISIDTADSSSLSSGTNTPTSPPAKPARKSQGEKGKKKPQGSPVKNNKAALSLEVTEEGTKKSSPKLRKKSKEKSSSDSGSSPEKSSPKKKIHSWFKRRSSAVGSEAASSDDKQEAKPLKNGVAARPKPEISYPVIQNVYLNIDTDNAKLSKYLESDAAGNVLPAGDATNRASLQYQNLTDAQVEAQACLQSQAPLPELVDKAGLQYQNLTEAKDDARNFLDTQTPSPDLVDKAGLQYQNLSDAKDEAHTVLNTQTPSPELVDKAGQQYQNLTEAKDNAHTFLQQQQQQQYTTATPNHTCYAVVDLPKRPSTETFYAEVAVKSREETDSGVEASSSVASPSSTLGPSHRPASVSAGVEYSSLNFTAMSVVAQLTKDHAEAENFAGLLERHNVREKERDVHVSRKKK